MKLVMFLISNSKHIFTKLLSVSESSIEIKVRSHWALPNFIYFSSYLQTTIFVWKRDCAISLKLQML